MQRLALLIGAADDRLLGVEGDLDRMEEALASHQFVSTRLDGRAATRAGILGALASLAARVEDGDAVVIYYSGHGGEVVNPRRDLLSRRGGREPAFYRCLIPTDIRETTADDFRGVLSLELDARVAAIADRSANVAVILDCCHSEGIAREWTDMARTIGEPREAGVRAYSLGTPWIAPIEALRAGLLASGVDPERLPAEADPRVIRLTACGPREIAVEAGDERGRAGLFTMHLAAELRAMAGRTTTWLALGRRVRRRVTATRGRQRPVIKGPATRLLFRLDEAPRRRVLPIVGAAERPLLGGGAMAGVEAGDSFLLSAPGDDEVMIGSALVGRCGAATAELVVTRNEGTREGTSIVDASAIPWRYARPRGRVRVRASAEARALIHRALPASGIVAFADDEAAADDPVIAEIREDEGALLICDQDGAPLRPPLALHSLIDASADHALYYLADTVEALALARALATLEPAAALALGRGRADWSLRTTDAHGRTTLRAPGAYTRDQPLRLGPATRLVVTVCNALGLAESIYAWVFSICPSGHVQLLSQRHPWGAPVGADEPYILGERPAATEEGIEVRASTTLPKGAPTAGALVLIAADGQADLRSWERAVSDLRPVDLLARPPVLRGRELDDGGLPGHARRFAVWRVPADLGGAV